MFALTEVEAWLRDEGKLHQVPLAERAWQQLRAHAGDDLRLAAALADAGMVLLPGAAERPQASEPAKTIGELAAALGAADAFEVLLSRLLQMQGRGAVAAPAEVAELMAALAMVSDCEHGAATVLDPACGTGELLLAARDNGACRLFGQDTAEDSARLAAIRLRLGGAEATVRTEDALVRDVFPELLADAVLCAPPVRKPVSDDETRAADPRWVYGVPPRLEPELAWAQHMLAHLSPAGLAVALMPAAAAARRPGRRIRAQLLRKGALRAVIALSATQHLWLLRKPARDTPGTVLMVASADAQTIIAAWRRFAGDPVHDEPGISRAVPIIDLLDDEVDLTPARHLSAPAPEHSAERFAKARQRLAGLIGDLRDLTPDLRPPREPRARTAVAVAELARLGHLTIRQAPARADSAAGQDTMLTAEDVIDGHPPSGQGPRGERWVTLRSGDIVVAAVGGRLAVRVVTGDGAVLGPALTLVRVDPGKLDPHFVAGMLRSPANARVSVTQTGSPGRADISRAQIPRLPLAEQRGYGDVFRRVAELESALHSAAAVAADLAPLLADAVATGTLEPPDGTAISLRTR